MLTRHSAKETPVSVDQLRRDGLAGPFELADRTGLDAARDAVFEFKALRRQQLLAAKKAGGDNSTYSNPLIDRHLDVGVIRRLYYDANVQSAVAELLGEDLYIWRSNFFVKSDGTGQNKWHHDRHFENGDAALDLYDTSNHFSITMALTDIGMDEGRIEYVKGSHQPIAGFDRDIPRHIDEVPAVVADRVTPLPLERGQFVLFHAALLHRSLAFGEGNRRVSMAARLLRAGTKIPPYGSANPAGGATARAEPIIYYRDSGLMRLN